MSANIAAASYALLSIAMPFALLGKLMPTPFLIRCFAAWTLSALLLFFLNDPLLILFFSGLLLLMLGPLAPVERICFFLVTAPCLPFYLEVFLPFPGINWLVLITHYKIAVIVLLVPLLFRSAPEDGLQRGISVADVCIVLYAGITTLLVTGFVGLTAGPRFLVDQILLLVVPYFVLSRAVRNAKDLERCFQAVLVVSLILAAITLVSTLKQWDFYRIKAPVSVFTIPDLRSGFLRIEATANTHSLGFLLALGVLVLEYLKLRFAWGFIRLWAMRGALLAALFFTDSRGAMLALAVALVVYFAVTPVSKVLRRGLMIVVLAAGAFGVLFLISEDASTVDTYGSIGYRQKLLTISVAHILEHPLLGDLNYFADPKFNPLIQGQGIIDITNFYLQVGLQYGLLGLALFMAVVVCVLRGLLRAINHLATADDEAAKGLRVMSTVLFAAITGWLALIATTSDVALTVHAGLILLSLGRAVSAMAPQRSREPVPVTAGPAGSHFAFQHRTR
jgi:O-antigen ligase